MEKGVYIYIMSNKTRTVLYIGVTSTLYWRVLEHQNKKYPDSFTSKYKCFELVYFETLTNIEEAIKREKQLKAWKRNWKLELIKKENPNLIDLSTTVKEYI